MLFFVCLDAGEEHATGMQVSWRLRLLHHQNLLDYTSQVPRARLHSQGEICPRGARGSRQSQPQQARQIPQDQKAVLVPEAHEYRPGVHRQVSELLRGGPGDRELGDTGQGVQQDYDAAYQRL